MRRRGSARSELDASEVRLGRRRLGELPHISKLELELVGELRGAAGAATIAKPPTLHSVAAWLRSMGNADDREVARRLQLMAARALHEPADPLHRRWLGSHREGVTLAEIARREGVSVSTVRKGCMKAAHEELGQLWLDRGGQPGAAPSL